MKNCAPNTFIIGAPKTGTKSLAHWLQRHPDVCMSVPRENRFFQQSGFYEAGLEAHVARCYPHYSGEKIVADADAQNMIVWYVPERINQTTNAHNIIMGIRDPIERFYSSWAHFTRMRPGRENLSFEQAVEISLRLADAKAFAYEGVVAHADSKGGFYRRYYAEGGMYGTYAQHWLQSMPNASFHYPILELKRKNSEAYNLGILDFLSIDLINVAINVKENIASRQVTGRDIFDQHPKEWSDLYDFYSDEIRLFTELTKVDPKEYWWGWQ